MQKRKRCIGILACFVTAALVVGLTTPKKVAAFYGEFSMDTPYQSDTLIKGYTENTEDVSITVGGKTYKASALLLEFSTAVPKISEGTLVTIASGKKSITKVVQPLPAPKDITYKAGTDGKYQISGRVIEISKPWKVLVIVKGTTYEGKIAENSDSFSISVPKFSSGENIDLVTVASDGTRGKVLRYKVGDTLKPTAPKLNTVEYGKTLITGIGEPFTTISAMFKNESIEYRTQVDSAGKFTLYVDPIVSSAIEVFNIDGCGNKSSMITVNSKDITPPAAPKVNALYHTDEYISGQGEKSAKVTVKIDSKIYTGTVGVDGLFKVKIPKQIINKTLQVYLNDAAGLVSPKVTVKVVKDTVAPAVPAVQTVYSDGTLLQGTTEANAKVEVYIGKLVYKGTANASGVFSVKIPVQKIGTAISVYAIDSVNNKSKAGVTTIKNYMEQYFSEYTGKDKIKLILNKNAYKEDGTWKKDRIFVPFIKTSPSKANLQFTAGFQKSDWVFFEQIRIEADGQSFTKALQLNELFQEIRSSYVKEYAVFTPDAAFIAYLQKNVVNGKKVTIYFEGKSASTSIELTAEEKLAIKQTLQHAGY